MNTAPPAVAVVHQDEWLAVVDKPAGLVVHPAPGHHGPTLVSVLGEMLAGGDDPDRPGIVHRLDRDTSGLMLVARTAEAHSRLGTAIAAREVSREYRALVAARLETGRTHQIRVHFAAIGHPVVGDPRYGRRRHGLTRQFLHSARLGFTHPGTGARLEFESELPLDLREALERARAG